MTSVAYEELVSVLRPEHDEPPSSVFVATRRAAPRGRELYLSLAADDLCELRASSVSHGVFSAALHSFSCLGC